MEEENRVETPIPAIPIKEILPSQNNEQTEQTPLQEKIVKKNNLLNLYLTAYILKKFIC